MITQDLHLEESDWKPTPLSKSDKEILEKIANTIRQLSMDAVQKANSGHPGLPMGCAELGAYLFGIALNHNPKNSSWVNRDRMVLSAGHGSMWLYSCLHLSGFELSLEEIKRFRQLHSQTPGHPESLDTDGVETTTGPLGQGVGNAVGQALGLKILAEKFYDDEHPLFTSKVFVLAGDGCIMEGISSEVSSLAGHFGLDNLVLIYDSNHICLDGPVAECCTEDTKRRYQAYGWDVIEIDGHDLNAIHNAISQVRHHQQKPTLIIATTIIGKGAPNKSGTHNAHGSPLGEKEVAAAKEALGLPQEPFYIPQQVMDFFKNKIDRDQNKEAAWKELFKKWGEKHPAKLAEFRVMLDNTMPENLEQILKEIKIASPMAGRTASQTVVNVLAENLPQIYGGSADLSCSDMTTIKNHGIIAPHRFMGRNIKFGVREFGMATMATGLAQTKMIIPFVGTFFTFSDYMRNAVRLAALQRCHVIYQFTHDSIFLGEDGPTHQPVEHLAALRAMPRLHVIRPADANEVKMAWLAALRYQGPTALILSRQNLPNLQETDRPYAEGVGRGAYIIRQGQGKLHYTLIATGSELSLALDLADALEKIGKSVRVISFPCWEIFEQQDSSYRSSIFGGDLGIRVSIEAGVEQGWHKYIGSEGIAISVDDFGLSAPLRDLQEHFGFTVEAILDRIL